jgi:hypothetical protein
MVSRVLKLSKSVIPDGHRSLFENGIDGVRKGIAPEMVANANSSQSNWYGQ